jgi:hypothetical protein
VQKFNNLRIYPLFMFWIKQHLDTHQRVVLAACDTTLLGTTLEEGDLSLTVSASFYGGQEVNADEFLDLAERAIILNLVGKEVVALATKHNYVDKDRVKTVNSVPHAQALKLFEED